MSSFESIQIIKSQFSSEIIDPADKSYANESRVWAAQKNLNPKLVIRPASEESLSKLLKFLSTTSLTIGVRSQGYGNASSKDVLISMTAFDTFSFNSDDKVVTLGAGQPWSGYYERMEKEAPGYTVIACRTPMIGVGGSTLAGGFSWLSAEYGCTSDSENLLDARVVKMDGSIIWASEEPELLWALRGTQGGFGLVTKFKLRAFQYPTTSWAGSIFIPRSQLPAVAQGITALANCHDIPQVSMFLYCLRKELLTGLGATGDMLVVHVYDALGEKHGRSEEGFKWALDIEGAIDMTKELTLKEVSNLQAHFESMKGKSNVYWAPIALSELTEDIVLNGFAWYDKVASIPESTLAENVYLIFELRACTDSKDPAGSAWLRPKDMRHVLLLGTGCAPDAAKEEDDLAIELIKRGPVEILGEKVDINIIPNACEDFHDPSRIYGDNYVKLQELKRKYDPGNKLWSIVQV